MGYQTVYERSMRDPTAFWAEAAELIDWDQPWDQVLDTSNPPFYRWFSGGMLNTCYNAVDRHVERGTRRPTGHHPRQPGDGFQNGHHLRANCSEQVARFAGALGARSREGRPGHHLHAHGARGGGRHAGLRPASAPFIRSSSAASRRTNSPPASTTPDPSSSSPPPAASSPTGSFPTSRCWMRPSTWPSTNRSSCIILQRPKERGDADRGPRPRLGRGDGRAPSRPTASRSPPPIRSTSSTPPAPPASPRAWCATMADMRWRSSWSMKNIYDVEPGEVFWAASDVGWVVGHSYIVYAPLLHGLYHDPLRGQARRHARTPAPSGGSSQNTRSRCSSPRRPPSAPSSATIPTASYLKRYDLSSFRALFLAGERCDPATLQLGRAEPCACR